MGRKKKYKTEEERIIAHRIKMMEYYERNKELLKKKARERYHRKKELKK